MPQMPRDELVRRLRAATTHPLPEGVRDAHLAAIHAAAHWADINGPAPAARTRWRRPITALVTAATLAAPPGIAVAAQSAQPGGSLYDVKLATERLAGILDSDLAARRRVEELRLLLNNAGSDAATIQRAIDRAMDAVASLPAEHPLVDELAAVLAQFRPSTTPPAAEDVPTGTGSGSDDHGDRPDEDDDTDDDHGDRPDEDDDTDDDHEPQHEQPEDHDHEDFEDDDTDDDHEPEDDGPEDDDTDDDHEPEDDGPEDDGPEDDDDTDD